jgi:hypothetical protein
MELYRAPEKVDAIDIGGNRVVRLQVYVMG